MLWLYSFHQLDILGLLLDRHPVTSLDISFINSQLPFHSIAQSTDIKGIQQSALKAALPRKHKHNGACPSPCSHITTYLTSENIETQTVRQNRHVKEQMVSMLTLKERSRG